MGRPIKFTPERRERFLEALRAGFTRAGAAGLVGVHRSLITHYCEADSTFSTECLIAEDEAEARMTAVVLKAVNSQRADAPKFAQDWLRARRRDDWGPREQVEVSGPGGAALLVEYVNDWRQRPEQPPADEDEPQ